jgi:hypothetical protein
MHDAINRLNGNLRTKSRLVVDLSGCLGGTLDCVTPLTSANYALAHQGRAFSAALTGGLARTITLS